jgi:hypothetical protein
MLTSHGDAAVVVRQRVALRPVVALRVSVGCPRGGGDRLKAAGIALPVWRFAGLAQIQKSGGSALKREAEEDWGN